MLNIPMFSTQTGVASLTLDQIPYNKRAYIRIQDTSDPGSFINECEAFCKVAGAEEIYATGHSYLEGFPFYTAINVMRCPTGTLRNDACCLFPVTDETAEQWRCIYNTRMSGVPNAAYFTKKDLNMILRNGTGYFVHQDGKLLGIGVAEAGRIDAVIATSKGAGYRVLCTLAGVLTEDTAEVDVASANIPAVRLYERAGFIAVKELSRWYKIF